MNFLKIFLTICLLQLAAAFPSEIKNNQIAFSVKLFNTISEKRTSENIIISSVSIRTMLALAWLGADGTTADELRRGLELGNSSITKEQVAKQFSHQISKMQSIQNATLKMANRIYVREDLRTSPIFSSTAQQYFDANVENVNFSESEKTANIINNWVEQNTENKIQNLISPNALRRNTNVVLANAIYFKALWRNGFRASETSKRDFHVSEKITKKVDMMYQENKFAFAEIFELDAKALTMNYNGTDIQMLILLPNKLNGLGELEKKLSNIDLTELPSKLYVSKVNIYIPKFKIEFETSLQATLETLGIGELFTKKANFKNLFTNNYKVGVSNVIHKAFIEVDENGTEAAAASSVGWQLPRPSRPEPTFYFYVDHPFFFAIFDDKTIYFSGHIADI